VGKRLTDLVHNLSRAGRLQAALAMSDDQLLERFALQREEAAFEAILHRHGPMVLGVCRRLLRDVHEADDAFQATFLVLARKASGIGRRSLLGNWLYGVAARVAARARRNAFRRQSGRRDFDLTAVPGADPSAEPDVAPLLHEEVQRLPDKYRGPVVLCYLEGQTNEEAATQLHWPLGTVKTRLNKARELLRTRLARRGVTLTAGLLAAHVLTTPAPAALIQGTIQAALSFAAGRAVVGGASAQALALTKEVLRTMLLSKLKLVAAAVLAVAVVAGGGSLAYHVLAVEPAKADNKPKEDKDAILGIWKVEMVEVEGWDASETDDGKRFKSKPMTITGNKMVIEGVIEMTYKLDPAAKPKAIDLDNGGGKAFYCVYSLDGNTLKICSPLSPGVNRPAEVATKDGSKSRLLVLKRETK
jgi:RNA polymerase sigma factor (sigma-70 family)